MRINGLVGGTGAQKHAQERIKHALIVSGFGQAANLYRAFNDISVISRANHNQVARAVSGIVVEGNRKRSIRCAIAVEKPVKTCKTFPHTKHIFGEFDQRRHVQSLSWGTSKSCVRYVSCQDSQAFAYDSKRSFLTARLIVTQKACDVSWQDN